MDKVVVSESGALSVVATQPGGPDVLKLVRKRLPQLQVGEMRVRVAAAGLNRPDVMQRQGNYPPPPGITDVLGLELSGEVVELGEGVADFAPGDRIMALVAGGACAEEAIVQADVAWHVPEGVSMVEAAAIPETYMTVWSNLFRRAGLRAGETVLVHGGTSGIGVTATLLACAKNARVITTCGSDEKCSASRAIGAFASINYRTTDFVAAARELTSGKGPDVILDMVGGSYIQRNLDLVADDGRIAQIAFQQGSRAELDMGALLFRRLTLTGSTLRARPLSMKAALARDLAQEVFPLIARGHARPVIDSVFALGDVRAAHERLDASAHVGKIVLTCGE